MRIAVLLLALTLLPAVPAAAQEGTVTPAAGPSLADVAPLDILQALEGADAPETLPGNTDEEIVLQTWEEHYGERLNTTLGAWVMTGSTQLPMASVLVFPSAENAVAGLGEFRRDSSATTAGTLEAWTIADRGKWICVAVDGPVMLIGQAEPEVGEAEETVRERSCEVTAATHEWMLETVGLTGGDATPAADG
ncbi:MAG TPA: hypothetical protein VGR22_05370 [Thermomicrobiales bacterium]|nr:hypothetical protein [Thermomicrobiales bacterium]